MSYSYIPNDVKGEILNQLKPSFYTRENVKKWGRDINSLSVNKEFQNICKQHQKNAKKVYNLLNKYGCYQNFYENKTNPAELGKVNPQGNPQLLDALLTGYTKFLPWVIPSHNEYADFIEADIKDIVQLTPESVHCKIGSLRSRKYVTPLAVACYNDKIPLKIVEYLLKNKADPNTTIQLNTTTIPLLRDVERHFGLDADRIAKVKELFIKYGANV